MTASTLLVAQKNDDTGHRHASAYVWKTLLTVMQDLYYIYSFDMEQEIEKSLFFNVNLKLSVVYVSLFKKG